MARLNHHGSPFSLFGFFSFSFFFSFLSEFWYCRFVGIVNLQSRYVILWDYVVGMVNFIVFQFKESERVLAIIFMNSRGARNCL